MPAYKIIHTLLHKFTFCSVIINLERIIFYQYVFDYAFKHTFQAREIIKVHFKNRLEERRQDPGKKIIYIFSNIEKHFLYELNFQRLRLLYLELFEQFSFLFVSSR